MAYQNVISRTDAAALIPEDASRDILGAVGEASAVLGMARQLTAMSTAQRRMPVLSALATAYFVTGDTGLKQTTEVNWANKYIDAEEIAASVPISKAVFDDSAFDIWAETKPALVQAFGKAIDQAVLYGTNIPATWTTDLGAAGLIAGCAAASSGIALSAYTDMYEAILGETNAGVSGLFGLVEEDGFMVTGSIAALAMKRKLRNVRDSDGGLIFSTNMQQAGAYLLDGAPCLFPTNGAISATYYLISGQWNQLVYAMRQDIEYTIATEGVITDGAGNIVYNLFQQDMIALRAVMRLGFALPNPINAVNASSATRYPFAYLTA